MRAQQFARPITEKDTVEAQRLDRAVGLGHVVITPGGSCFLLIRLPIEAKTSVTAGDLADGSCDML